MEKFENSQSIKEQKEPLIYKEAINLFIKKNDLIVSDEKDRQVLAVTKGLTIEKPFVFIKKPINPELASKLESPKYLETYFERNGFSILQPKPIINKTGITLFISAGVQHLDDVIYKEANYCDVPQFVAQPVLRSQFVKSVGEGSSTSFINICTEKVNPRVQEHFSYLEKWLELLDKMGLKKENISFQLQNTETKWADKKFKSDKIKIFYDGLEIGVALYNTDLPQNNRDPLCFSDIGFGLERIKWILQGGQYFNVFNITTKEHEVKNPIILNHILTMALLAGSGIKPANKEHGYRLRLFSKKFISENIKEHLEIEELAGNAYRYWSNWINLPVSENEALLLIQKENERNFNRELLNSLKLKYVDVDIDINQSTEKVLKLLRGTSVDKDYLIKLYKKMHG